MQPSIIIADDHPLILKGLQDFLSEKKFNVIDSATNGKDALKLILEHNPDVAILDIRMPHLTGLEIAKACKEHNLATKIVLITFEKDGTLLNQAEDLNVFGYILKEFALAEIETCLQSLQDGDPYFSPNLKDHITEKPKFNLNSLSEAEKKILKLIAQNKTTKEIAEGLFVSTRTIEKHRSNIIRKLGLDHQQNSLLIWVKENQNYFM